MTEPTDVMGETAFVTQVGGHLLLTGRAEVLSATTQLPAEMASAFGDAAGHPEVLWLTGRFVEAGSPNRNGAFWDGEDLRFGEMTARHAPLNFLHRARHVVGTIAEAKLFAPTAERASAGDKTFIGAAGPVWKWLYPHEARLVEIASEKQSLYYSMECVSQTVRCETSADGSRVGCGKEFPHRQALYFPQTVCEHIQQKTSQRHFVNPYFHAGGLILPPVRPGWADARVEIRKEAERLAEQTFAEAASESMDDATWVALMEQVLAFGETLAAT